MVWLRFFGRVNLSGNWRIVPRQCKANMQTKIDPVPTETREAQGLFFYFSENFTLPF